MDDPATVIRPQPGPQETFLATPADIAIYGGAAGGGKSWALLAEPLRHVHNPDFAAVIFRRTATQVRNQGGLWDEAARLYPQLGATARESALEWRFPSGARVRFAHLEHERTRYDWQGAQVPLIGFDELTHFSREQMLYLLGRNRSTCGVRPYVRATCNPDPDSFAAELVRWWIDPESGYPVPERSGAVRWFVNRDDEFHWADSPGELTDRFGPDARPKSLTFIAASIFDNRILLEKDPGYLANLEALPRVERERLKAGNWLVRADAGSFFQRRFLPVVEAAPARARRVRAWDLAAGEGSGDWTVGVKLARAEDGTFHLEHVERFQGSPGKVEQAIRAIAESDGPAVTVSIPQDPGQAGKAQARWLAAALAGYPIRVRTETGSKETRAAPVSAQAEAGNLTLVRGPWLEPLLREMERFPKGAHDDQVDALAAAFHCLTATAPRPAGQGKIKGVY